MSDRARSRQIGAIGCVYGAAHSPLYFITSCAYLFCKQRVVLKHELGISG